MIEVVISELTWETKDILGLDLAPVNGGLLPAFTAGAHVDVHLPGGIVRQYSLSNAPRERHRYQLGVLRAKDSKGGSAALHSLKAGMRLTISEPRNLFPLAENAAKTLLVAGGIGVTPIIAMAEHLHETGADFHMHYFTRGPDHTAYHERIRNAAFADHVTFHFDSDSTSGPADFTSMLAQPQAGHHLYVCGPSGFMSAVLSAAEHIEWPANQLHREYFAAADSIPAATKSFEIEISSTGQIFTVPPEQSIAQVLEEAGIYLPLSCEQGVCGACITTILAGLPDHRDMVLTEAERADNNKFTPCVSRSISQRLVLDL